LVDLAQGYQAKFGIKDGSFILKCCNTALTHFPNYINAMLLKSETLTALYKQSKPDSEENKKLLAQMNEIYSNIHQLGYTYSGVYPFTFSGDVRSLFVQKRLGRCKINTFS